MYGGVGSFRVMVWLRVWSVIEVISMAMVMFMFMVIVIITLTTVLSIWWKGSI